MSDKWDYRFIDLAKHISTWSKDPSTQVGAVIVGQDKEILSVGFNGLPRDIQDTHERLCNKVIKYKLVVHAEINAVLNAVRNGINTKGATMYVVATDVPTGKSWGGAPCIRCSVELIQSGIKQIIVPKPIDIPEKWKESCEEGRNILKEARVIYKEI